MKFDTVRNSRGSTRAHAIRKYTKSFLCCEDCIAIGNRTVKALNAGKSGRTFLDLGAAQARIAHFYVHVWSRAPKPRVHLPDTFYDQFTIENLPPILLIKLLSSSSSSSPPVSHPQPRLISVKAAGPSRAFFCGEFGADVTPSSALERWKREYSIRPVTSFSMHMASGGGRSTSA